MRYYADFYWNKGKVRDINQDSLVLLQALTSRGRVLMAAVCDGMGGMNRGEYASGYLTEELVTWFYDGLLELIGKKKPFWVIRRSGERKVYQIQSRLQKYGKKNGIMLGTTMSLLVLWEKNYFVWHLGDSRIYRIPGNKRKNLLLLTKDHVRGRNELTKCVGSFGYFVPDFRMGVLKKNDAILLCSDGFWNRIDEKELQETLAPGQMEREKMRARLWEIGEALMRRGERDNLSAIYVMTQ